MVAVAFLKTKQGQWLVLALAVIVLGWLFIRAAGGPAPVSDSQAPGALPSRSATVTGTAQPTQRHPGSSSSSSADVPTSGLPWVAESALPREAHHTLDLIRAGGPYPYPRNDDKTFTNRERVLPKQPSGYYREYTVVTPGSDDRGARRIISGRDGDRYYTDDHYASFRQIREST